MTPFVPLLLLAALPSAAVRAPGNDTIRAEEMRADLMFLAGDGFRGRLTATPENDLATEFVASRFARLGLKSVVPDGSYYFRYNLSTATLGEPTTLAVQQTNQNPLRRFATGTDVVPLRLSASAQVSGRLTFVGFGVVAPGSGWDDYRGVDLTGRVALALEHEAGEANPESPLDGVVMSESCKPVRKVLAAQQRGAVAFLFVTDAHNHPAPENFEAIASSIWPAKPRRVPRYMLQSTLEGVRIPVLQVSRGVAADLLRSLGRTLVELGRASESAGGCVEALDETTVMISTDVRRHTVSDRSVLAAIEGSDPQHRGEWVVVSGHHDHDGADGSTIYNGADDNGSGTIGVLEIAEAYASAAREGHRPKRSVLFASFNSEERGLLGSWAFVARPPVPLDKVVAVLNMDMIGRDEEVPAGSESMFRGLPVQTAESNRNSFSLLGYSRSASLTRVIERANESGGFGLRVKKEYDNNPSNLIRRSDHWPFLQRGVPGIWFHTGLHPDYHTADDRPEKIRYEKMERVVRLVHQASWDLANADDRPRLDPGHAPAPRH